MKGLLIIALKNLRHRIPLTVAFILLTALLFSTGSLLRFLIRRQEEAIDRMTKQATIVCTVTNASGTKTEGIQVLNAPTALRLQGKLRDRGCTVDDYVSDLRLTAREDLVTPDKAVLIRANCPEAVAPDLTLQFYEGWDGRCLEGSELICCISQNLTDTVNADGTLTVELSFFGETKLRVIGIVIGSENIVLCPFDTQLIGDAKSAAVFLMDRCVFTIPDASRLEEAKAAFAEWFVTPSPAIGDNSQTAGLLIQDAEFSAARAQLQTHIALLWRLRVVFFLLGCVFGFLVAFLVNRNRLREFAVMRLLGLSGPTVALSVVLEQFLPMLPGIGFGVCISLILTPDGTGLPDGCLQAVLYLCGGVACAWLLTRAAPIRLMKEEE